jgi:hypothetical protein
MAIPLSIILARAALRTAFNAATPLESAPPLVFAAVRDKARDLVVLLDAATASTGALLDESVLPTEIQAMPAALLDLAAYNADEAALWEMRNLAGRVLTNINLSVG